MGVCSAVCSMQDVAFHTVICDRLGVVYGAVHQCTNICSVSLLFVTLSCKIILMLASIDS